ncbi:MAG: NUDIX domain-containing protein [Proteobacteria bacterium]|nr:NUDIX domain-containing protein [Pseudomonadota bacterium]MBU1611704.1 NUDIX domain-containing protein [Pseudomonadota bacterium]
MKSNKEFFEKPNGETLVEVVDTTDRPLMHLYLNQVHEQRLPHRSVVVLLYGPDNKIWLQKRSRFKAQHPGRWDVSTKGHVLAGESAHGTAVRKVQMELGLKADKLKMVRELQAGPETGFEFTTVFSLGRLARLPEPDEHEVEDGYYYSSEELAYLVREFRELMTPKLLNMWEGDLLFPVWDAL